MYGTIPAGMHVVFGILIALLLAMSWASPRVVAAQGITQQQADELISEIRQLRQALEQLRAPQQAPPRPQPSPTVKLAPATAYAMGRDDAPLTVVEFTDLECPFCQQFHMTTFEQLKKNYIDTGKLRFVARDFPLDFHPMAMPAAHAVRCAGEQGKFWEMRHVVVVKAHALSRDVLFALARDLGLEMNQFSSCVTAEKYEAAIQKDIDDARAAEVSGTPTFVLGRTSPDGLDGVRIVGALPYNVFESKIKELLGQR